MMWTVSSSARSNNLKPMKKPTHQVGPFKNAPPKKTPKQ